MQELRRRGLCWTFKSIKLCHFAANVIDATYKDAAACATTFASVITAQNTVSYAKVL